MGGLAIDIRHARAAEAAELSALAHASKASWGYPARWLEMWREALTITPGYIEAHAVHVAASDSILGFTALIAGSPDWHLDHLWVAPAAMRRGVGRALFAHAADWAAGHGAAALAIDSEPFAEPFYLQMGAVREGEIRSQLEGQTRIRPQLRFRLSAP